MECFLYTRTMLRNCLIVACFTSLFAVNANVVRPDRGCRGNICEFDWDVSFRYTMMWANRSNSEQNQQLVITRNGQLYRKSSTLTCNQTFTPLFPREVEEDVITGDGSYKLVYLINGMLPGPTITVYEDQTVVVVVKNKLKNEGISIHWHGLIQRATPWMDGPSMISQCPILPGQSFTYRFLASPSGTHWYHAHVGTLRTDGPTGALVVLPRIRPSIYLDGNLISNVADDFVAVVQDWIEFSTLERLLNFENFIHVYEDDFAGTQCRPFTRTPDGSTVLFKLIAGVVNGRGRRYPSGEYNIAENSLIPLETFTVMQGRHYRFRFINTGILHPFKISIDAHMLVIVAFDGNDVQPYETDGVVISPGESVDFIVYTGQNVDNYYINFNTVDSQEHNNEPINFPDRVYAVLNYYGVDRYIEPTPRNRPCTPYRPCTCVNQVYGLAPQTWNVINIPLTALKSTAKALYENPVPIHGPSSPLQEVFLNFRVQGTSTINNRRFVHPTSALQTYPRESAIVPCNRRNCSDTQVCSCTNILKARLGGTLQLVLFSRNIKVFHPIHLHGHHFHVLKIAYPEYDPVTGNATRVNQDILCLNEVCSQAVWRNPNWNNGNIPGLNLVDPPMKDTVNVPFGGYVIIRLRTDNPGFWFLHCHLQLHLVEGMALVLQEGEINQMPPTPPNFPTCNNFDFHQDAFEWSIRSQNAKLATSGIPVSFKSGSTYNTIPQNEGIHIHVNLRCAVAPWTCKKPMFQ